MNTLNLCDLQDREEYLDIDFSCPMCDGGTNVPDGDCPLCDGEGEIECPVCDGTGGTDGIEDCNECNWNGYIPCSCFTEGYCEYCENGQVEILGCIAHEVPLYGKDRQAINRELSEAGISCYIFKYDDDSYWIGLEGVGQDMTWQIAYAYLKAAGYLSYEWASELTSGGGHVFVSKEQQEELLVAALKASEKEVERAKFDVEYITTHLNKMREVVSNTEHTITNLNNV